MYLVSTWLSRSGGKGKEDVTTTIPPHRTHPYSDEEGGDDDEVFDHTWALEIVEEDNEGEAQYQ